METAPVAPIPPASADRLVARLRGGRGAFELDVALEARLEGVTALFGPSGSGKTTLLRAIAGLERMAGSVRLGGEVWQDDAAGVRRPVHDRAVGYVFQEASLFPHLSVRRNLAFGARRAGPGPVGWSEAVALLGLGPLLDRRPARLSGGERQRVAIGRALLSQPKILLMDEPLTGLDRRAKAEILGYLDTLSHRVRIPILYVSHDIGEVTRLADRMALINDGRIAAEGPVERMLERLDLGPATGRFEAGVVLSAEVSAHDQEMRLTRLSHAGQLLSVPLVDAPLGAALRLRIRARDVMLALERPEGLSVRNVLAGVVAEIREEPDTPYAETLLELSDQRATTGDATSAGSDPGAPARLRARVTREALRDLALAPGRPVFALVKTVAFDGRALTPAPPGGALGARAVAAAPEQRGLARLDELDE